MNIVKLIGDRLALQENGNKFKSICPFHLVSEDFVTLLIDPAFQRDLKLQQQINNLNRQRLLDSINN